MMIQKIELKSNFNLVRLSHIGGEIQPYIDDVKIFYNDVLYDDIFWISRLVKPEHDLAFILDNIDLFYLGQSGNDISDLQIKDIKDEELKQNLMIQIKKTLLKRCL